jgi:hypothetical protein
MDEQIKVGRFTINEILLKIKTLEEKIDFIMENSKVPTQYDDWNTKSLKDLWDEQKVDGTISTGDCEPTVKETKNEIFPLEVKIYHGGILISQKKIKYDGDLVNLKISCEEPTVKECDHTYRGKPCNCSTPLINHYQDEPSVTPDKIEEIISDFEKEFGWFYGELDAMLKLLAKYKKDESIAGSGKKHKEKIESWLRDKLKGL